MQMTDTRDWEGMRDMSARLLKERTGENVETWNRRIKRERFKDEQNLRVWLKGQGVTNYAQSLLVMERFGYPDFLLASAHELIDGQYADRSQLQPIFNAIVAAATRPGDVVIQARNTYVSLVSPRRQSARFQPLTKVRTNLILAPSDLQQSATVVKAGAVKRNSPPTRRTSMPSRIRFLFATLSLIFFFIAAAPLYRE